MQYDVTAAVTLAELGKLVVSLIWTCAVLHNWKSSVGCTDAVSPRAVKPACALALCRIAANDRASFTWPLPRSWSWDSLDLMSVALLYSFTNEFNFLVVERLGAALFMILGNLKIVRALLHFSMAHEGQ
eukprot:5921791-Amphidinium_carterae.1